MGICQCKCKCLADAGDQLFPDCTRGYKEGGASGTYHDELMTGGSLRLLPNTPLEVRVDSLFRSYTSSEDAAESLATASSPHATSKGQRVCGSADFQLTLIPEEQASSGSYKSLQLVELDEVPANLSTVRAKEVHEALGQFQFSEPKLPGASWRGPVRLADGSVYIGEWNDHGMPHGRGRMYYIEGGICDGEWNQGKLNGEGRYVSPMGDVYTGAWLAGQRHGRGNARPGTRQHRGEPVCRSDRAGISG